MITLARHRLVSHNWRYVCTAACILSDLAGCGSSTDQVTIDSPGSSGGAGDNTKTILMPNVQPIRVNSGPSAPSTRDANMLYTDVTICVPGTSNCQTIADVLVDTGSSGLRLLASEVRLALPSVNDTVGNPLGECVVFADTSYVWGPVVAADIQLASEKAAFVPIQLIGSVGFPRVPTACGASGEPDDSVAAMGSRGILGLGVFEQDCGTLCTSDSDPSTSPDIYFGCPGANATSSCALVNVPLENQVQNPVRLFSEDNNGLIVSLPPVPKQGAPSVTGSLIFGIGTRENNTLGSAAIYKTNDYGTFSTSFNGIMYADSQGGYIDSGSNLLSFPSPSVTSLPVCADAAPFYCPSSTQVYTATNMGLNGVTGRVLFEVANADLLFQTGNVAFSNLAGTFNSGFAWGLPFFFGRNVFVAIEGQNTPAGTGPYWAY